jgi:DNA-binding NarL/FixJ family response regulator
MTVRVVIADDERLVRAGLRMILQAEADIEVVGEAEDGFEAVEKVAKTEADVVLMDIRMPHLDGLEATRRILARPTPPKVIVLTTFDLDEYVYKALRAGASSYLLKDAPEEQLVAAVKMALHGGGIFAASVTRRLIEKFASYEPQPTASIGLDRLTIREQEVFELVARGYSNHEIAEELVVSEHTVKTHVAHILQKLGLRDRIQVVVAAYEWGVLPRREPDPRSVLK